jgi:hypothetical protein
MQPHKSNDPCRKIPNDPNLLGPFRIGGFSQRRNRKKHRIELNSYMILKHIKFVRISLDGA